MTDSQDAPVAVAVDPAASESADPGGYGVGPFTVREVSLLGVWLVAFVVSFFPVAGPGTPSVWTSGLLWILTIGVPTAAVGLLVLRRFSPDGIRRVGSLGVDQFASVAFAVSAVVWLQFVWASVAVAIEVGGFPGGWVQWVELILMLAGVVLTVFAPLIPVFAADFAGRREIPAHRAARPVQPVQARPAHERAPKPPREPKAPKGPRRTQQPAHDQQGYDPNGYGQGFDPNASGPQGYAPNGYGQGFDPNASGPQGYAPNGYGQGHDPNASGPQGYAPTASLPGFDTTSAPQGYGQGAPAYQGQESDAYGQQDPDRGAEQSAVDAAFAPLATDTLDSGAYPPVQAQPVAEPAPAQQAFWALVPVERDVVDQNGAPLFRIGPSAWALVIEDRGTAFVVRDEDGRTGFLLDVSGVMRG